MVKKILHITFWICFAVSLLVMVGFTEKEQKKMVCQGITITLDQAEENSFLTHQEIRKAIVQLLGDSVEGKPMDEISISLIRERLEENAYVKQAIVFSQVDGWLVVKISQRTPIIRVQNSQGQSFYLSHDGHMIPVSFQYSARVPFANGTITEVYDTRRNLQPVMDADGNLDERITTLQKLYLFGKTIVKDPFLLAQIPQVFVTSRGELELIPLAGDHIVLLGNVNDIPKKLTKLSVFYRQGLNKSGWDTYKTINIKYNNQVICSKN